MPGVWQILMLDPLPLVAKVFNLVIQEEWQRTIWSGPLALCESLAFSTPSSSPSIVAFFSQSKPKCNRSICSHCGLTGHTVDHCYKLHGYPLGYKPKPMAQLSSLQSTNIPSFFPEPSKDTHFSFSTIIATTPAPLYGSLSTNQV